MAGETDAGSPEVQPAGTGKAGLKIPLILLICVALSGLFSESIFVVIQLPSVVHAHVSVGMAPVCLAPGGR